MTTELAILLIILAGFGAWALWQLCVGIGRWLATVFFGRQPGGRK